MLCAYRYTGTVPVTGRYCHLSRWMISLRTYGLFPVKQLSTPPTKSLPLEQFLLSESVDFRVEAAKSSSFQTGIDLNSTKKQYLKI